MLKRIIVVTLIGMSVLAASRLSIVRAADNPLQGAWQVTNANGFAGIFIFSAKHYSMMAASTERPDISDLSKATADEVRALYGPMIGNAGAYEISGNQVTIRPVVAKIPVVMKPGGERGVRVQDRRQHPDVDAAPQRQRSRRTRHRLDGHSSRVGLPASSPDPTPR
jgi:hypothetical protein